MKIIENQTFSKERDFYESQNIKLINCTFSGIEDGESAFKEAKNIHIDSCCWNLRYPFWHVDTLKIENTTLTENCRAALWYTDNIKIEKSNLHGIKALRECSNIKIENCSIISPEFGWFNHNVEIKNTTAKGEYFMMKTENLNFDNVSLEGKYSFQYIENATFVNCKIIGTQPLCYCKNLKLINCEMEGCDLSFEKSSVEASIISHVLSIKNPTSGTIEVPSVGEMIIDSPDSKCKIIIK